jgi:hypothetical protein
LETLKFMQIALDFNELMRYKYKAQKLFKLKKH